MTFGEKLQRMRKQDGLSQEQLAEKLNVSRQAISKWETGTIPDLDNLVKIGRYFDCSLDYLVNNEINNKDEKTQVPKMENKNLIQKGISVGCIIVGIIISLLMPLFAKLYQAFELEKMGVCYTNASNYILRFPLLGILLIAILLLSVGIVLLYRTVRKK